jgi:seryl-tRNA synthetase
MTADLSQTLDELILGCENVLRSIDEARKADNRRKEFESALIEIALNQKDDKQITKEMKELDKKLTDLENDIKKRIKELSDQLDSVKNVYNERIKEGIGEIKEIARPGKNV